jgi:8-oxo-dGTP diphosphatase
MSTPPIDVAVNILRRADGRVLLAERTPRQISAGFWELPGGKVDPGETPPEAARRELEEEIGVRAVQVERAISYEHAFRTRRIRLHFFRVLTWEGTPVGREGQRLAWIDPSAPDVAPILPSNDRILLALGLPPLYALSGASRDPGDFVNRLPALLAAGVRLIGIDAPLLSADQRIVLARRVNALAAARGAHVLLCGTALDARRAGVLGAHSTPRDLSRLTARPPVRLWIASCASDRDLATATALGADAAVLTHTGQGEGLRQLAAGASIPVYATGPATSEGVTAARRAGAIGVAAAA